LIGLFIPLLFNFLSSLYILDINLLSGKEFHPSVHCHFILVIVSSAVQRHLNLMKSHLSMPAIVFWTTGVLTRKSLPVPASWHSFHMFSAHPFKFSVIHWDL
jgi:hypothetical protein